MKTFRPSKSRGVGVLIIFLAAMLCLFYYLYPEPPMSTSTILFRMKYLCNTCKNKHILLKNVLRTFEFQYVLLG